MYLKTHRERREEVGCKPISEKIIVKFFLDLIGIKSEEIHEFPTG